MTVSTTTPVCLLILDGFGYREEIQDNAIAQAKNPIWTRFGKIFRTP